VRQYSAPTVASGALLGLIFGLSFLDRTEGILYLAFIPFVQVVHYWFTRDRSYSSRQLIRWGATFIAVFVLLAAPQVWRVSRRIRSTQLRYSRRIAGKNFSWRAPASSE